MKKLNRVLFSLSVVFLIILLVPFISAYQDYPKCEGKVGYCYDQDTQKDCESTYQPVEGPVENIMVQCQWFKIPISGKEIWECIEGEEICTEPTVLVAGTIYNSDFTEKISYADVNVECNGIELYVMSKEDGTYVADFTGTGCSVGDTVNVYACKDGMGCGRNGGVVNEWGATLDVAIVNVSIPEFSLAVGIITALSAVGIFFILRRK